MSTPFRQGLNKVYLPNIVFQMVRATNLQPNQAAFRVPQSCNKFDIHSYLTNIYGVNVQEVRTMNYAAQHKKTATGQKKIQSAYKKAIVTLDQPFQWPASPEWCKLDVKHVEVQRTASVNKMKGWRVRLSEKQREAKKDVYEKISARAEAEQKK
ncbi:hypothetical protein DFQ28_001531 [Apophysomyces sp. BC1034]|nr:hypothetical protein DFQ30_002443 [Apophysomyces sp. BC1015]KAG0166113.1 hypothetical protein DFQ29_001155 [Apophysomyces sp. BC1021]KAG0183569.1 hypothetical protein DFQ28_001531 [Apophysomyces sp. BC1034]